MSKTNTLYGDLVARRERSETGNQNPKTKNDTRQNKAGLDDKIINAMANTSVILMSTMMGAFTQVIVNATGAMGSEMAEIIGGKKVSDTVDQEIKQGLPEFDEKMKAMISDIRKDIYAQMQQKKQELDLLLSDPAFEVGPKIVEKYDFKLPRLTQELDDIVLSQYSHLLVSEDVRFVKMFKELTEWINSLPNPNRANQ